MIVRCTHCDAAYAVDDGKITNKKFGFSCPKCGTNVIIDNRNPSLAAAVVTEERGRAGDLEPDSDLPGDVGKVPVAGKDIPTDEDMLKALDDFDSVSFDSEAETKEELSMEDFGLDSVDSLLEAEPGAKAEHETIEDEALKLEDFGESLDVEMKEPVPPLDDIEFAGDAGEGPETAREGEALSMEGGDDFDSIMFEDEPQPDVKAGRQDAGQEERSGDLLPESEIKSDDVFLNGSIDVDDSTTIDMDSLDIDLDEGGQSQPILAEGPLDDELILGDIAEMDVLEESGAGKPSVEDDFDTTIDLDTLDITLDEVEELKKGVDVDDDERLTLEDTGLTIDELSAEDMQAAGAGRMEDEALPGEEDIKLNLHEIDPSLSVDDLAGEGDLRIMDDLSEETLPEIDLEKLQKEEFSDELFGEDLGLDPAVEFMPSADDHLDIETRDEFSRYRADLEEGGPVDYDTVPGGVINFSIDYSLSYSRLGAVLRLVGLFAIGLLPRFFVNLLYSMVSGVLLFINSILVIFRGYPEEDFLELQENTLRAGVSLAACAFNAVEEMPNFTGRKNIDYSLQLSVIFPVRYSRFKAFLRLTVLGMFLIMLPHLVLLTLLTLGALLIYLAGLVWVIIFKKWPNALFDFMVRYFNYSANVSAFMAGLVDRYPSFRFE